VKIKQLTYSSHFLKAFRKLDLGTQRQAVKRIEVFSKNPFDPRLKTHKLSGKLEVYWSFSVNYSYRVLVAFGEGDKATLIDIGSHNIYK